MLFEIEALTFNGFYTFARLTSCSRKGALKTIQIG